MRLHDNYNFRGLIHSQQRTVQAHRTPSIATSSVRFLIAEECFSGEPQAAAKQGFLSGATHHIPSISHPSSASHSSWSLCCVGSLVCATTQGTRSGKQTGLEMTWEGIDCFSGVVNWEAVYLEQSRLKVRGREWTGMVGKPCQHGPQGDGWFVLSYGILQMVCFCGFLVCGFIFSWGNS